MRVWFENRHRPQRREGIVHGMLPWISFRFSESRERNVLLRSLFFSFSHLAVSQPSPPKQTKDLALLHCLLASSSSLFPFFSSSSNDKPFLLRFPIMQPMHLDKPDTGRTSAEKPLVRLPDIAEDLDRAFETPLLQEHDLYLHEEDVSIYPFFFQGMDREQTPTRKKRARQSVTRTRCFQSLPDSRGIGFPFASKSPPCGGGFRDRFQLR
mmetsp:Transcript_39723/g.102328  ORF Transcript_39723/g.102328 Transcript_39723/m.102328 type:complete len:210 (+) Transcript_39723:3276-3905(+)